MTKSRTRWAELGILPAWVGYVPDKSSWKHEMRKMKLDEPYPGTDGRCTRFRQDGRNQIILLTFNRTRQHSMAQVTGLIAHECMHAWRFIREDIGEAEPSTEFEAYTLQALVQFAVQAHADTRKTPWRQT